MLGLISFFKLISCYSAMAMEPENVQKIIRKAFQEAQWQKTGGAFTCLPENIAGQTQTLGCNRKALPVNRSLLLKESLNKSTFT